jgi:transcriptional regulator with XRE-family HTH domain
MPESFGTRLRRQRERQHVALTTIAEETKIKLSLLDELERDNVSHWPDGIFRRAFVRSYAHAIGLQPDVVLREFLELHPEPIEALTAASIPEPGVNGARTSARPPSRLRYAVGSAMRSLARLSWEGARPSSSAADDGAASEGLPVKASSGRPGKGSNGLLVEMPRSREPDLLAVADLCTKFARADRISHVAPLLQQAVSLLGAVGLIVWVWDPEASTLTPALAHGYSDKVLAQLPPVRPDMKNTTAAAFRSAQICAVRGSDRANGALVVPLMMPVGCVGVLAIESPYGSAQTELGRAVAIIFAAQLARLIGARAAERSDPSRPDPILMSRRG